MFNCVQMVLTKTQNSQPLNYLKLKSEDAVYVVKVLLTPISFV